MNFSSYSDDFLERHSNVTTERYTFHKLVHQTGQPVKDNFEMIQKETTKYRFESFESETCKDQIILGMIDTSLKKYYLLEDCLNLAKLFHWLSNLNPSSITQRTITRGKRLRTALFLEFRILHSHYIINLELYYTANNFV